MKYCSKCGAEIVDEAVVCVKCGAEQTIESKTKDKGGFGWGTLGCCVSGSRIGSLPCMAGQPS